MHMVLLFAWGWLRTPGAIDGAVEERCAVADAAPPQEQDIAIRKRSSMAPWKSARARS
jgi:hypothetical protein